jgi:hypothetical protein
VHFFIGIEANPAIATTRQPGRQRHPQLAARRLLPLALMQPQLNLMKFSLAHDPGQAEQQTVMIGARIVHALAIGDQRAKQRRYTLAADELTLHHLLTNPVYAGAYAFGRRGTRVIIEDGRKRVVRDSEAQGHDHGESGQPSKPTLAGTISRSRSGLKRRRRRPSAADGSSRYSDKSTAFSITALSDFQGRHHCCRNRQLFFLRC